MGAETGAILHYRRENGVNADVWRRRGGLFGFRVASAKASSLISFGTALRHPAQAVLAGRTRAGSSTHLLNQIEKGTLADALFNLAVGAV